MAQALLGISKIVSLDIEINIPSFFGIICPTAKKVDTPVGEGVLEG